VPRAAVEHAPGHLGRGLHRLGFVASRPRDEPLDDGATDDDYHEKAGEIRIAKAFVDTTDIVLAMDGLTSDHEFLASQIIDGTFYEQEFADWFDDEFGVMLGGDPVFVLDLVIDEKHRDPDCLVAAHAQGRPERHERSSLRPKRRPALVRAGVDGPDDRFTGPAVPSTCNGPPRSLPRSRGAAPARL
jgi:hypothetical protein